VLDATLKSIENQTYRLWECIVVDDGSTDGTASLVNSFLQRDPRFQYIHRPASMPKGPSACRNYGYEHSKGDYIQWFDSDDLMHPEKLKVKLECALNKEAEVIIDDHSESDIFQAPQIINTECFTSAEFYIDFILGKKPVITNDVMLKRAIINEERFDEYLWKGEEFEFFGRIFQQKLTYCFLDVALTCYRISPDSISISPKQTKSLIYLSKKLQVEHASNSLIVERAKRQGRKTYKALIQANKLNWVLSDFKFFKECYHKSTIVFMLYIVYNTITKRGFDKMKPRNDG
jgi:glycosyltransferase involved in cell wall biosynthesis